jgi:hypothetical protein
MEKQTAVEWLYKNLKSHFEHDGDLLEAVQMSYEQAKAMEKEEIEQAYKDGWNAGDFGSDEWAEIYYKETYESKKNISSN